MSLIAFTQKNGSWQNKGENNMTKEKLLFIAERNVQKAEKAIQNNYDRPGITEQERENLRDNRAYTLYVQELIRKYATE